MQSIVVEIMECKKVCKREKIILNEIEKLKEIIDLIKNEYADTFKSYSEIEEFDLIHLQNLKEVYSIGKLELSNAENALFKE